MTYINIIKCTEQLECLSTCLTGKYALKRVVLSAYCLCLKNA